MQEHIIKGREAENIAVMFLVSLGFDVLHINWRHSHYEIDIVATKEEVLHFIEVKGRWGIDFGEPEEAVSELKFRNLQKASRAYQHAYPKWKRIQFDIIAILIQQESFDLRFMEDVYYY